MARRSLCWADSRHFGNLSSVSTIKCNVKPEGVGMPIGAVSRAAAARAAIAGIRMLMGRVVQRATRQAVVATIRTLGQAALRAALRGATHRLAMPFYRNAMRMVAREGMKKLTRMGIEDYNKDVKRRSNAVVANLDKLFKDELTGFANMRLVSPVVIHAASADVLPHQNIELMWLAIRKGKAFTDGLWDRYYKGQSSLERAAFWAGQYGAGLGQTWFTAFSAQIDAKALEIQRQIDARAARMRVENRKVMESVAHRIVSEQDKKGDK